jgi:hypothetical protein
MNLYKTLFAAAATMLVAASLAFAGPAPTAESRGSGVCTLFCIQGYHCVVHGGNARCVPNHEGH